MNKLILLWIFLGIALLAASYNEASAVCCFPYEMTTYIDPETDNLVVNGELWNDSYKGEPFGNSKYEFLFYNSTGVRVFEKELVVTKEHPIQEGFVIHPGIVPLPFQIVIDDVDIDVLKQVTHVSTGRTSVQYFDWKPPDLKVDLQDFSRIATITSKTQDDTFDKWQITGTITNTHSETTQNVYVVASLYNADPHLVGVAGYSDKDIQPMTLDGHQTKVFQIHALVPQEKSVQSVRLYAESDDSSAKYDKTKPIILRPAHVPIKHGVEETPITISANVTNITRDDMDFDWIIQIKKSHKSLAEGDITKYPNSTVAFVKMIPASVSAQDSTILEYSWVPESGGIYFYEMFLWDKYKPVSSWFRGSFLYSDQILVSTNSLKDQLTKNIPLDKLDCRNDLVLTHRASNSNFVCVKPDSLPKLVDRGWAEKIRDSDNPLREKWTYNTKGEISSIDISEDDSIIVVGTKIQDAQKGMLYVLDNNGTLLWKKEFDSMISNVDISNDAILVQGFHICGGGGGARTHCNYTADVFDIQGTKQQSYSHDDKTVFGASLSPNGSQIITHTYDVLKYFNIKENDSWTYNPDESIRHMTFLTDFTLLVNTDNTGEIIALDNTGDKLWNFTTNYPDNYSYAVSSDGKYFAISDYANPDDGNIYLLDYDGNLLWKANTGNTVLNLEFSGDDSRILARINDTFMVYDIQGNLLWGNNIPSNLTISSDGSFLLGTTFNQGSGASITLFDGNGNILSNYPISKDSLSSVFALANNDEYLVMAKDANSLVMFELKPDFDKVYYDLTDLRDSDDLHVRVIPKTPGLFDVTIAKGDSIEIPWDIKFDEGFTKGNFGVSIESDSYIESWITPTSPYTIINGVPPGEKIITIHPIDDAKFGTHTIKILGEGDSIHNKTGWMTNLDGKTLGTINVTVIPKQDSLSIKTGKVHSERGTFCVEFKSGNGNTCTGLVTYQRLPITVFSNITQTVTIDATTVQKGGWIKFVPDKIVATPNGTSSEMLIAGYLIPFQSNPLAEKSLIIEATSKTESTTTVIPIRFGTISVIKDEPSPISLGKIRATSNGTHYSLSNAVYDPLDSDSVDSIPVSLSVLGMWEDGTISDLPEWISVDIPEKSFALNAKSPYYFMIVAQTDNAPISGTYHIAINENINGENFTELQELVIDNRY